MVFASTAFSFATTSSGQICLASSEHIRKYSWGLSEHFENFPLEAILFPFSSRVVSIRVHQVP